MLESLAPFVLAFIGQREIIVGIGISGGKADGGPVGFDGLGQTLEFIEYIAEIEKGERIVRIGLDRLPIEPLRTGELLLIVENRSRG